MSQQAKAPENKTNKKRHSAVEATVVTEPTEAVALAMPPVPKLRAGGGDGFIENQMVAQLSDRRIPSVRRRTLAREIGDMQGNGHLRHLMASTKTGTKLTQNGHNPNNATVPQARLVPEQNGTDQRTLLARRSDATEVTPQEQGGESFGGSGAPMMTSGDPASNGKRAGEAGMPYSIQRQNAEAKETGDRRSEDENGSALTEAKPDDVQRDEEFTTKDGIKGEQQDLKELLPDKLAEKVTTEGAEGASDQQPDTEKTQQAVENVDTTKRNEKVQELKSDMKLDQVPHEQQQEQAEQAAEQVKANVDVPPPAEKGPPAGIPSGGGGESQPTTSPLGDAAGPSGDGAADTMQVAESAAEMADQATDSLDSDMLSDPPQVEPPEPITPVDAGGASLPGDEGGDLLAANVAERINILRQHGQHLRSGAKFSKSSTQRAKGTIAQAKQTVAQSEVGVEQMAQQTAARKDVVGKAETALQVSEQKAEIVANKAPELVAKADEGKEKTGPMADEADDLASENNSNVPDDPKAGGKMNQQGQKLNKVSSDVTSLDDAINQSKTKANTLGEEAAQAKQKNAQTKGQIAGAKATLEQTEAKIDELRTQNTESKEQLESFADKPNEMMTQAATLDDEGQALIDASVEMETMLQEAQEQYLSGMQSIPAAEQGNNVDGGMVQRSPLSGVVQRGGYDDRGSVLGGTLLDVPQSAAFTGDFSTDEERRADREREVQRRRDQLARINQMGDGHFERASAGDKMLMSLKLLGENLFGGISDITVTDVNKFLGKIALAFVNPLMAMGGVVAGLNMVLRGGANVFSAEQWSKDPLGNLLKSAADIATGLTVILGSISALAGVIILLMSALVLVTFGFAAPLAAAVIPICTTVLATTLPWTITVGKIALVLQGLTLIKNLYDAATASTADELQQNAEQMSDDVKNIGGVALAIGGAKLGRKALPQQKAWAESLANMPPPGGGIGPPGMALAGAGGGPGGGSISIGGGALTAEGAIVTGAVETAVGTAAVTAPMAMVAHGDGGGKVPEEEASESEPRPVYEASEKHGSQSYGTSKGVSNPAPKSGQEALNNSVQVKGTSPRRVGVDRSNNEIVVFDETHPGKSIYHGHVRQWKELTSEMQNALRRAGLANRKGKITSGD